MASPFVVVQDFISNKFCEELVDRFRVKTPNLDKEGKPVKLERILKPEEGQDILLSKFYQYITQIETTYDCLYKGLEQLVVTHNPENDKKSAEPTGCENAEFFRRKWIKKKDVDLTGVLWLKDYNEQGPFDNDFEVYGGKREYPAYNFSLTPQRGTLIIHPAGPHFITATSPVVIGDLYQIKFNISVKNKEGGLWDYQPKMFPASSNNFIQSWFTDYL